MTPLAVWDAREDAWMHRRAEKTGWLLAHGLPADEMYRAEFYLVDAPFARIFCYRRDDAGRRYMNGDDPAEEKPRDVLISELPPRFA